MNRLLDDRLLVGLAALVVGVAAVDAAVSAEWDLVATAVLGLVLLLGALARSWTRRRPATVRADLAGWLADQAHRTGERQEVLVDRALASYRRRVDPAEGHTAAVGATDRTHDREARPRGRRASREDGDEGGSGGPPLTVVLRGGGVPAEVAGGKGASLDRLVAAGAPVPPTGVLTTAAYERSVDEGGLRPFLEELAAGGAVDPAEAGGAQEEVDRAFLEAPLPDDVADAIVALARDVGGGGRVAVRSSATAEDLHGASFAGQYRSFLDVDEEGLLRAVRLTWASLWSPAVRAYREHRGVDEAEVAMAVVVMRMVEAERAGVLFTADPGGARGHARIEHVEGLAEGLVSGTRTPEAAVVPRDGSEAVPDGVLREVLSVGLAIEDALGGPQDVEWAHDGTRLHVVQARPITADAATAADDDGFDTAALPGCTYTTAGIGEMLPGVLPPLLWSIDGPLLEESFRELFDELGALPEPLDTATGFVGRFRGRAALNLDLLARAARTMPGGSGAEMERQYFGEVVSEPDEAPAPGPVTRLRAVPAVLRAVQLRRRLRTEAEVLIQAVEQVIELGIDPAGLDDAHLLAYWRRVAELATRVVSAQVGVAAAAAASYRALELFLEQYLGDDAAGTAQRLTAGGVDPCGVRTSLDVCDLVAGALDVPTLREALVARDGEEVRERLLASAEGRAFLSRFRELLGEAGSAAVFAGPTWEEDERLAWNVLQQAVTVETNGSRPHAVHDRRQLLEEVRRSLTGTWRWRLTRVLTGQIVDVRVRMLRRLTADAVHFLHLRERTKLAVLRLGGVARRTITSSATRLVEEGRLPRAEDVELLGVVELEQALAGAVVRRDVVARRRRALATATEVGQLPRLFDGRPEAAVAEEVGEGDTLRGWAASQGRHRGRVRVVLDPATATLEDGDVLVAPATDPSWTPLFLTAGALVVEEGGPLSHAAIVARELGLPAVLNVAGATRRLADGGDVTVDGTEGVVRVHDGGEQRSRPRSGEEVPA